MKLQRPDTSSCLFGVALLLLTLCTSASAGGPCYKACLDACLGVGPWAFATPLGIAVGFTGCNTVCMVACATGRFAPACFANDTTIAVSGPDGKIHSTPVSAVRVGDQVLTFVDGRPISTRVVRNVQSKGSFDFFEFDVRSDYRTVSTLKVTPQHAMLLLDAARELRFFLPADIRVGDEMLSSDGSTWNVSNIRHSTGDEKFTLVTSEGSVLASGVLVSTICNEEISPGLRMDDVVEGWKLKHSYDRYAHSQVTISA